MAMFNLLELLIDCPYCANNVQIEAEFRFGFTNLDKYRLGDKLRWNAQGAEEAYKRPEGGHYTGEGYVECPVCHRDLWISITVYSDVIVSAEIDTSRQGYITNS